MSPLTKKVINFGAGPAKLPQEVLRQAQTDLLNWNGTGIGILEVSHRSKEFQCMMKDAELQLRKIVQISNDYAVLFMPGGGTLQFSAIVFNLLKRNIVANRTVDYLISGSWSQKAAEEAEKLLANSQFRVNTVDIIDKDANRLTMPSEWNVSSTAAYIYYCDNETIDGIEMPSSEYIPDMLKSLGLDAPVIADMSSNFLTRPVDVKKFGIIFATAQKNFGPAGITVVIVKRELLNRSDPSLLPIPIMMDYNIFDTSQSLYNTPPSFAIHVCNLVFRWIEREFGSLAQIDRNNTKKAQVIYECVDNSNNFYYCPIATDLRSRVNAVFRIRNRDGSVNIELEEKFVTDAEDAGLFQLRGHRSIGGMRISLYNAITLEDALIVVSFMNQFAHEHGQ